MGSPLGKSGDGAPSYKSRILALQRQFERSISLQIKSWSAIADPTKFGLPLDAHEGRHPMFRLNPLSIERISSRSAGNTNNVEEPSNYL